MTPKCKKRPCYFIVFTNPVQFAKNAIFFLSGENNGFFTELGLVVV